MGFGGGEEPGADCAEQSLDDNDCWTCVVLCDS
jgi:hypothetical protein